MKPPLQTPVLFDTLRTMADGSIKVTFVTRELPPEHAAALLGYRKSEGWLLFKPAPFEDSDLVDIPETVPEFAQEKTPSQRLRNVLYRLWEYKGKPENFETWRKTKMEQVIQHFKEQLP
jgi:hypothetical protein